MEYLVKFDTNEPNEIAMLLQVIDRIRSGDTVGVTVVETNSTGVVRMSTLSVPRELA